MKYIIILFVILLFIYFIGRHRSRKKSESSTDELMQQAAMAFQGMHDAAEELAVVLRRSELEEKYGSADIADAILSEQLWIGQKKEMLIDAFGDPDHVESHVTSKRSKEILSFQQDDNGNYLLKVSLNNGIVSGWDKL